MSKASHIPKGKGRQVPNPLKKLDGNLACICDGKKKLRFCCGEPRLVPARWAAEVQSVVDTYNQGNKSPRVLWLKIKKIIKEGFKWVCQFPSQLKRK